MMHLVFSEPVYTAPSFKMEKKKKEWLWSHKYGLLLNQTYCYNASNYI